MAACKHDCLTCTPAHAPSHPRTLHLSPPPPPSPSHPQSHILASRGPLPFTHAASVLSDILTALASLHAKGLTHGDVKPANVVVQTQGVRECDGGRVEC